MATIKDPQAGDATDSLLPALAARMAASMLPGDTPFPAEPLAEAARFLLATARQRTAGEPALALESLPGPVGERRMRIAAVNDNMPFLVDSLAAAVTAHGLAIDRLVHPVMPVRRDAAGLLTAFPEGDAAGEKRESLIYLETARVDARTRRSLLAAIETTLADVRAAVADWPAMRAAMAADAERTGDGEGAALLRWFEGGMLTQLGHVLRHRDGSQTGELGICRQSTRSLLSPASYARAFAWFETAGARAPLIVKSNHVARVHRHAPLDLFLVPVIEGGRITALSVHAGLWTSAALASPAPQVPRLRSALADIAARFGFDPGGHAGKALVHALTILPNDLLVSLAPADLERVATATMSLIDRPRPRLILMRDALERHLYAFVWMPRDALSTAVRLDVAAMLEQAAEGTLIDWALDVEGSSLAMLRFVLDIRDGPSAPDSALPEEAALETRLAAMVRGWGEAVEAELATRGDASRAAAIAARHADAFPQAYRSAYGPAEAATDIERLRRLEPGSTTRDVRLHAFPGDRPGTLRLKLYQRVGALALSDTVPTLENFGFRVIDDTPTLLAGEGMGAIHDFALEPAGGLQADGLFTRAAEIEAAIAAVLNGAGENDGFNRLIALTGLSAEETGWLRAFYRYLRQAGMTYGVPTAVDALARAPQVARGLVALFRARHDPALKGDRARTIEAAEAAIREGLAGVAAINDDRLLRAYRALIGAILRTNAFAPAAAEALAFKLDSALVPGLPRPVPWREIFVYSPRVEGIHLRSGPVARGGLRWSDRRDDFRTEVLGLMKAQKVKNAVIVPAGAKGGFYPKQLPDPRTDRDGWLAEGRASYQVFVRALLSLTDNIVDGRVVHPAGVTVLDGDDPYFVVAADKGTASYSDTANALAEEAHFWLGDAFASGGSKGYDHKAMGITARGAWISVQRHFRELGVDVQSEPVRVAGCGDMSGDVFGNGMLLSKAIRLVAAFDHRHVFLDPDPDPAKSHAERARLFALPRSSWDDYDKGLISPGGGVFPRSQKEIPLSPQVREMLGVEAEALDPESLISAILRAPVDLLWFGGIGTYVKAGSETNGQVGDPANDALRVNGAEVRARVIGEGANLGCTQAGRIEFALSGHNGAGGRINTDFIDNSAGVDCSDNEVNIKIALETARRAGKLAEADRVALLSAMTGEVADIVLEDNRLQALALSIAEAGGAAAAPARIRLIEVLEELGHLDRKTEGLADAEAFRRRAAEGRGLVRPELAVLLSTAKLALQDAIEQSPLPDDPGLADELLGKFPTAMREACREEILHHRLRREIIATRIANRMVNRLGPALPFELAEEEAASPARVAAAFVAAERLLELDETWDLLEATAMPEPARIALFSRSAEALRAQMADLLRAGIDVGNPCATADQLAPGVAALAERAAGLLREEARQRSAALAAELAAAGAPDDAVARVVHLADMDGAIGLARLARDNGQDAAGLTRAFAALGAALGLDWAQGAAARMSPADPWERLLAAGLARDFQQVRLDFLRRICGPGCEPEAAITAWLGSNDAALHPFRALVDRARASGAPTPAMLARIAGQARSLLLR